MVGATALLLEHRDRIVEHVNRNKIPTTFARRDYVDAGGLVSYGWDTRWGYRRSAEMVHRILQGAKPAELPVERPAGFHMVLNLKTARALGIKIPVSVQGRADEVIE